MKHKTNIVKYHPQVPLFIAIEGIDGSGKTTIAGALSQLLTHKKIEHITTAEPTKQIIHKLKQKQHTLKAEVAMFLEDRLNHIENVIKPNIHANISIICDRYHYSTLAYQFDNLLANKEYYKEEIHAIMNFEYTRPSHIIYLDIPLNIALERLEKRKNKKDQFETVERLKQALLSYRRYMTRLAKNFHVIRIDPTKPLQDNIKLIESEIFDD